MNRETLELKLYARNLQASKSSELKSNQSENTIALSIKAILSSQMLVDRLADRLQNKFNVGLGKKTVESGSDRTSIEVARAIIQVIKSRFDLIYACKITGDQGYNIDSQTVFDFANIQDRRIVNAELSSGIKQACQSLPDAKIGTIVGNLPGIMHELLIQVSIDLGKARGRINSESLAARMIKLQELLPDFSRAELGYLISQSRDIDASSLLECLKLIKEVKIGNLPVTQSKFSSKCLTDFRKSMTMQLGKASGLGPELRIELVKKLVVFWTQLLSDDRCNFQYIGNIQAINFKLVQAIQLDCLTLEPLTCPDYTGNCDENGVFRFDFQGLGSGPSGRIEAGVVAQKSLPFVRAIYDAACKTGIAKVEIVHMLPTFEFSEAKNSMGMSKDQIIHKMREQLEAIKQAYSQQQILDVQTELSADYLIQDCQYLQIVDKFEDFLLQINMEREPDQGMFKQYCFGSNAQELTKSIISLTRRVYKNRATLYAKWYPQYTTEADEDYQRRLSMIPVRNIAEYLTVGLLYKNQRQATILIDSSNATLSEIHRIFSNPVLFGFGIDLQGYEGDK